MIKNQIARETFYFLSGLCIGIGIICLIVGICDSKHGEWEVIKEIACGNYKVENKGIYGNQTSK